MSSGRWARPRLETTRTDATQPLQAPDHVAARGLLATGGLGAVLGGHSNSIAKRIHGFLADARQRQG